MLDNIQVGKKYRGLINNAIIEVVKIEKGYVSYQDLKTLKKGAVGEETFKHLLLEEVD